MAMFALMNVVLVQEFSREGLLCFPDKFWSQCHEMVFLKPPAQGHLSNDAGWVLLQNYREKGIVYHLVVLADKYQKSQSKVASPVHGRAMVACPPAVQRGLLFKCCWYCGAVVAMGKMERPFAKPVEEIDPEDEAEEEPEANLTGLWEKLSNDEVVRARLLKIATLRTLYELVSEYWEPRKKASSESLEGDSEVTPEFTECPLEDGYEETKDAELLVAKQLGVVAETSDAAALSPALKSGVTEDLEKLSFNGPDVPVKRPAPASSSKAAAKRRKAEILEISDSPCRSTPGPRGVDLPARIARLNFLRQEIQKRSAAMAVARPLQSNSLPSMDVQDTCPADLSPIAKNLENKFVLAAVGDGDDTSPAGRKEDPALVAVGGDESHQAPKEKPEVTPTPAPDRMEDDVFYDATELSRNQQIEARDDLKQSGGTGTDDEDKDEEDDEDEPRVFKKPAAKVKPAAALKAAICKAKAKVKQDEDEIPAPKRRPGRPKKEAEDPEEGELESEPGPTGMAEAPAEDAPAESAETALEGAGAGAEPAKKKRIFEGLILSGCYAACNFDNWALIEIMVLLASMDVARPCEHFDVVEMFAGSSRVSRLAKGLGKHAVALDKSIDESMDLNTDAGFLFMLLVLLMVALEIVPVIENPASCYPPRFASKLLRMQKDFADRRPILPEEVTHHRKHDTLIDFLKRLPDDDWNDAELYSALKEEISSAEGPVADAVLESINDNAYKFLLQSLKAKDEVKQEPELEAEGLAPAVVPVAELPPPEESAGIVGGEQAPTSKDTQLEESFLEDTLVTTPCPAKDAYYGPNSPEPLPEEETPKTRKPSPSEPPTSAASKSSDASVQTGAQSEPDAATREPSKHIPDPSEHIVPPKSMPFDFAPPTQAAINARLRRIFKPRASGEYQVDAEFIKMYKDKNGGGQEKVYKLFERTGFNPVTFVKHCKKVTQQLSEEIRKAGIKRKSRRTLVETAMEFEEDTDNEMD
ncbi:unnamed protein product, partial [Symbiodinium sp. KB8]